jgi:prepilin-type N-terminal cleavage/methylation domain-containing protein
MNRDVSPQVILNDHGQSGQSRSTQLRSGQRGFSLIELLVAITMLTVVVLGISLLPAMTLGRQTDSQTYAVNLAREVMDSYRAEWSDRTSFRAGTAPTLPTNLRFGCTIASPTVVAYDLDSSYALTVTTSTTPMIRKVTVSVTCSRGSSSLSSFMGDPTPADS